MSEEQEQELNKLLLAYSNRMLRLHRYAATPVDDDDPELRALMAEVEAARVRIVRFTEKAAGVGVWQRAG